MYNLGKMGAAFKRTFFQYNSLPYKVKKGSCLHLKNVVLKLTLKTVFIFVFLR